MINAAADVHVKRRRITNRKSDCSTSVRTVLGGWRRPIDTSERFARLNFVYRRAASNPSNIMRSRR
jgi:hypothetical protein